MEEEKAVGKKASCKNAGFLEINFPEIVSSNFYFSRRFFTFFNAPCDASFSGKKDFIDSKKGRILCSHSVHPLCSFLYEMPLEIWSFFHCHVSLLGLAVVLSHFSCQFLISRARKSKLHLDISVILFC